MLRDEVSKRFIHTLCREWGYCLVFQASQERMRWLPLHLGVYNQCRCKWPLVASAFGSAWPICLLNDLARHSAYACRLLWDPAVRSSQFSLVTRRVGFWVGFPFPDAVGGCSARQEPPARRVNQPVTQPPGFLVVRLNAKNPCQHWAGCDVGE